MFLTNFVLPHKRVDISTQLIYIYFMNAINQFEQYNDFVTLRIRRMGKSYADVMNRRFISAKIAISFEQVSLLMAAIRNEGKSMVEIARITYRDKAGVLRGLRSLESGGFIKLKSDPHNMRIRHVFSTKKAKDLSLKVLEIVTGLENELLSGIDLDDITTCLGVIDKLNNKCIALDVEIS